MLRGGDTGQFEPATVLQDEYGRSCFGVVGRESLWGMRLGRATKHSTLLGPERTTRKVGREVGAQGGCPGSCCFSPGMTWLLIPVTVVASGGGCWGCGLVVG